MPINKKLITMTPLEKIEYDIINHPDNSNYLDIGYKPTYSASTNSKIILVGQAPGIKAQESGIPWNDVSGDNLRKWLGVSKEKFYDESIFALIPMDFYFPGKAKHGDLPPRKTFAPMWHPLITNLLINTRLTILIGRYAQIYYLGSSVKNNLTETVRSYKDYLPNYIPLVHPSPLTRRWQTKNIWFEDKVLPELKKVVTSIIR